MAFEGNDVVNACDNMMAQAASMDSGDPFAAVREAAAETVTESPDAAFTIRRFFQLLEQGLISRGYDPAETP